MKVLKKQPFWQYEQISADLIRKIETDQLPVNSKLPSEKTLCDEYGVSRITIRKALAELEERKYIVKKQGRGSFVESSNPDDLGIGYVDTPSVQLKRHDHDVKIKLEEFSILAFGEEQKIRELMGLKDSEYLYRIKQIYLSDRAPLINRITYLSFKDFPMIKASEIENRELMPMLIQKYSLDPTFLSHEINTSVDDHSPKMIVLPNFSRRNTYVEATTQGFNDEGNVDYLSTAVAPSASKVFFLENEGETNMSEPHILLTRIDNRLVHGQVGVTWTKTLGANLILVANDEAADDVLQQKLMKSTADSSGAQIRFFTLEKTIKIIGKAADRQKIFIVVKTPADALALVEGGVPIKEVNVGNMHFAPGKEEVTKKVYVDDTDKKDLMKLVDAGVNVYIEDVPGDHKTQVNF